MHKFLLGSIVALALLATSAYAGQNAIGAGFSGSDPGSVGPSISGDTYGNTSNPRDSGHGVLPSESPGPWKHNGDGPTDPGGSMGDFLSDTASGGKSKSNFANDKDPGPDFVK